MSSDAETFSTPPTSPNGELPPSLSRRNSRPTSLQIDRSHPDWNSDIVLEAQSPDSAKSKLLRQNGHLNNGSPLVPPNTAVPHSASSQSSPSKTMPTPIQPMHSPCFVHSHLDKGASLADWLRMKQHQTNGAGDLGVSKSLQRDNGQHPKSQVFGVRYPEYPSPESSVLGIAVDEEEDYGGSLTKQLAETAVGVREMSKQLGE
jgi:NAD+ kinase